MLSPGDIILIPSRYISVDHDKFAFCICPEQNLYFYVNTKPYIIKSDAQVRVLGKLEYPFLEHTSYIDTSAIQRFETEVITNSIYKGKSPANILKRVREVVKRHEHLTKMQQHLVLGKLC